MSWVKVLNSLPSHPKAIAAGDRACWLYVCGLCYANAHLTDGFIARGVLVVAAPGVKGTEALARKLVAAGLWDEHPSGWQIHDYQEVQRTSDQIRRRRRQEADRKARERAESATDTNDASCADGAADSSSDGAAESEEPRALARSRSRSRGEENNGSETSATGLTSIPPPRVQFVENPND